jgi:hypothetical protein
MEAGFQLQGKISHMTKDDYRVSGYYGGDGAKYVQRVIYIGNNLYTLSPAMIKATGMEDFAEKSTVEFK